MTFKLFLPASLALVALSGIMLLPTPARAPENLPALLFAVLAHVPAFLPVSQHGKLLTTKSKLLNSYPEILVPPVLALSWLLISFSFDTSAPSGFLGALTLTAICVCYVSVRACVAIAQHLRSQTCQSASLPTPGICDAAKRYIYVMRGALSAFSLSSLMAIAATMPMPGALFLLPISLAAAAISLTVLTWHLDQKSHAAFRATVKDLLARQLQASPTTLGVYHAGTKKADLAATKALCTHLNAGGRPYVLITREAAALEELRKLAPLHLWHAEKLAALTHCAQPKLRTILYAQDHPKNSHFTRNTQFDHVLVTAFSQLATARTLPQTLALYSKILACSDVQVAHWKANAPQDLAGRLVSEHPDVPTHTPQTTPLNELAA